MAEVHNRQAEGEVLAEGNRTDLANKSSTSPQAVGVYDRPALDSPASSGILRMIIILAALVLLGYLLFTWVT